MYEFIQVDYNNNYNYAFYELVMVLLSFLPGFQCHFVTLMTAYVTRLLAGAGCAMDRACL